MYISYNIVLEMCNLETLSSKRHKRCLNFSLECLKYPKTAKLFPLRPTNETNVRDPEVFSVNFAKTSTYKKSAIPFCQRLLNEYYIKKKQKWYVYLSISRLLWIMIFMIYHCNFSTTINIIIILYKFCHFTTFPGGWGGWCGG